MTLIFSLTACTLFLLILLRIKIETSLLHMHLIHSDPPTQSTFGMTSKTPFWPSLLYPPNCYLGDEKVVQLIPCFLVSFWFRERPSSIQSRFWWYLLTSTTRFDLTNAIICMSLYSNSYTNSVNKVDRLDAQIV